MSRKVAYLIVAQGEDESVFISQVSANNVVEARELVQTTLPEGAILLFVGRGRYGENDIDKLRGAPVCF